MAISFSCLQCGAGLNVKEEYAGKNAKCPQCGVGFVVPQPAGSGGPSGAPAPFPDSAEGSGAFPGIHTRDTRGRGSGSGPSLPQVGPAPAPASSPNFGPGAAPAPQAAPNSSPTSVPAPLPLPSGSGSFDAATPGSVVGLGSAVGGATNPLSAATAHDSSVGVGPGRRIGGWAKLAIQAYPILAVSILVFGGLIALNRLILLAKAAKLLNAQMIVDQVALIGMTVVVTLFVALSSAVAAEHLKRR